MPPGSPCPSPLVERAAALLRGRISDGQWPVGTKLPGEVALAASLGVGRSTVREALRVLAGAGLVRARQGAGVFVIADRVAEEWPVRLRRAALHDIYEVRAVLEVQAARLAAHRRTAEDLATLDAALAVRSAAARRGGATLIDADLALHAAVVAAAHNPVLTGLFGEFTPRLREALLGLLDPAAPSESAGPPGPSGEAAHAALVEAIRSHDPNGAGGVLLSELRATQQRLRGGPRQTAARGDGPAAAGVGERADDGAGGRPGEGEGEGEGHGAARGWRG